MNYIIEPPLISIITATYNSSDFILNTYQSISRQTYSNWEWLVTDDCSDDNTFDLLCDIMSNDSRVRVFRNLSNSGAAVSRNKSLDNASGSYIAFVDSDDIWLPTKLSEQLAFMQDNNEVFTFTGYSLINRASQDLNITVDTTNKGRFSYKDMLAKKATLGCSTVMLASSLVVSKRMPLIRTGQDYAYWLSILRDGLEAVLIPKPMTKYRVHPGSISRNKLKKAKRQFQIYRNIENLNLLMCFYYFSFYALRAVFRRK
ncbi:glycosyltransferase family 2 protein [Shewanella sp.]|uniref:glycosyltransferase family 2 protein n=1 Tax=Shewanella sp. TaxID=50422 RepID=UPI0035646387